jgi:hypothetical protein
MGDSIDDLVSCGVELDSLLFGDTVRDRGLGDPGENGTAGEALMLDSPKPGLNGCEDWSLSGSWVLGTTIGAPGKKGGRGLTGTASPDDVMDDSGFL